MKNKWYKTIAIAAVASLLQLQTGCTSTFDDLNTNPDSTTEVQPSMLATTIILDMVGSAYEWTNEFMVKRPAQDCQVRP